jgi:hypothetical protein
MEHTLETLNIHISGVLEKLAMAVSIRQREEAHSKNLQSSQSYERALAVYSVAYERAYDDIAAYLVQLELLVDSDVYSRYATQVYNELSRLDSMGR